MAKKMNIDFKRVLVEKGEKIGFYAAVGILAVLLIMGGIVASKAASPGGIVKDMDAKVIAVQQKTVTGDSTPPAIDSVVYQGAKVPIIQFNEIITPNPSFDRAVDQHDKRGKPEILKITEAQAQFIRGSLATMELIEEADGTVLVGVLTTKAAGTNQRGAINRLISGRKARPQPPGTPQPPPTPPPGAAGGRSGGGKFGGGGGLAGAGGGGQFGGGPTQNMRSGETEVQYMKIDAKGLESAKLAENILPKRMVVITGSIPYKKQLEVFAGALRARSPQELPGNDLPLYRGY